MKKKKYKIKRYKVTLMVELETDRMNLLTKIVTKIKNGGFVITELEDYK